MLVANTMLGDHPSACDPGWDEAASPSCCFGAGGAGWGKKQAERLQGMKGKVLHTNTQAMIMLP